MGRVPVLRRRSVQPPDRSALALWLRRGQGLYQDSGGTTLASATSDPVARWNDALGGSSFAHQTDNTRRLFYGATDRHAIGDKAPAVSCWLELRTGGSAFSLDQRNCAVFVISRQLSHRVQALANLFFAGSALTLMHSDQVGFLTAGQRFRLVNQSPGSGTFREASVTLPTSLSLVGMNCSASEVQVITNNTTDSKSAFPAGSSAASYIAGVPPNDYRSLAGYQEVLVYNRTLTATELAQMRAYAASVGVVLAPARRIVVDGDSITQGASAPLRLGWVRKLERAFGNRAGWYCTALDSKSLTGAGGLNAEAADFVDVHFGSTGDVCTIWAGTNDAALLGETAANTWASLEDYVNDRVAAGWRVIVGTMLPRNGVEAFRTSFNSSIRAAYPSGSVRLCDLGGDSRIGAAGANTSTTYYDPDQIHLNDAGHNVAAELWAAQLNGWV